MGTMLQEAKDWIAHEEYFELTCLQEKSELAMEDFFAQYPSLKPAKRSDVIALKKGFVKFMDMQDDELFEVIAGKPTAWKAFDRFVKGLKKLAVKEFNRLTHDERAFLKSLDEFMYHKLLITPGLKDIKQKKVDFLKSKMTMKEFAATVMAKGSSISLRWDMDPSYEVGEKVTSSPEWNKAFAAFQENKKEGEIFGFHFDGQTNQTTFHTIDTKK